MREREAIRPSIFWFIFSISYGSIRCSVEYSSSNSAVLVFEVVVSVLLVSLQVEHAAVQVLLAALNVRARLELLMN